MRRLKSFPGWVFAPKVVLGGIIALLGMAGCGQSGPGTSVPSVSATVVTHEQATGNTARLSIQGFVAGHGPSCQVRRVAGQKELIVVVTARTVLSGSAQDLLNVIVANYHGDGVYTVPDAEGSTQVSISMTGAALAGAQQLKLDPTLGFQVGGTITVEEGGKSVSFSGGNSLQLSLPSTGTISGKVVC